MRTLTILAALICSVAVCHADSGKDSKKEAYEKGLEAIMSNNFVFIADAISTPQIKKSNEASVTNITSAEIAGVSINSYMSDRGYANTPTQRASPGQTFILLQVGDVACVQGVPIVMRNPRNIDNPNRNSYNSTFAGVPTDVRTKVKRNGSVEQSMKISNYESNMIIADVYITMKKGSNQATATVGDTQLTGRIVPVDEAEIYPSGALSAIRSLEILRNWSE